jgi:uncharacterized LabA/DUF88 family protein
MSTIPTDHSAITSAALPHAIAYVDGQNLFHEAQRAFGYDYPNFDVLRLAQVVCTGQNWTLKETRFYTGIPGPGDDPFWNTFWQRKLRAMSQKGIKTFSRGLRFRTETLTLPDGTKHSFRYQQEKGIDVRIAMDALRGAFTRAFDVAIFFSLDQDLSEVALDIRATGQEQGRQLRVASAFPWAGVSAPFPIGHTTGITIDRATYDACIDARDYRPAPRSR